MSSGDITIYVTPELKRELSILPRGTTSRVCRDALRKAVAEEKQRRQEALGDLFAED